MKTTKIQLLHLRMKNFRSFRSEQILNFSDDGLNARNVTAIFGPNASGKSNTARALWAIKTFIINSTNAANNRPLYDPFRFNSSSINEPSELEIKFRHNDRVFTYSFATKADRVVSEILKEKSKNTDKYRTILSRNSSGNINKDAARNGFGKQLIANTRNESLIITRAQEYNNEYSNIIFEMLDAIVIILDNGQDMAGVAIDLLNKNPELFDETVKMLKMSDFSIRNIDIQNVPVPEVVLSQLPIPEVEKNKIRSNGATQIITNHAMRDGNNKVINNVGFGFAEESTGTKKFFTVAVPIIYAIKNGKTLYIDEFGSYLHPTLASSLIQLYQKHNENVAAKLIINTHSTVLMDGDDLLKREDIVLVQKNMAEESIIIPLNSKSVRKDEPLEKRYRQGIYGAVPTVRLGE